MKKIYVAHPFGGKRSNFQAITHICQRFMNFGVIPISPVHAFSFTNDHVPEERNRAMEFCDELIEVADCIFFFGEWETSEGCRREMDLAKQLFKPFYIVEGWKDGYPVFKNGNKPIWWKEQAK